MFIYPWGDLHSLNLGWFLMEFKAWVEKIQEYLDNGGGTSENLANVIAPVFNAANSYLTGDYVLYNDELYKALEPVPPGTWNPDAWVRCLVTEEMGSSASGVDNVARLMIAVQYSNTYNYQKYAICRYADKLWMCNTNLPAGGEEWEPSHWDEITVGAGLTGLRRSVETLSESIETLSDDIDDLNNTLDAITPLDTTPTNASGKGITSGAVYNAISALQTVQKIPVTVNVPSQFNLDAANPPQVYRSGGLGFLVIVAWTNQDIPTGSTSYNFTASGVKMIPTQSKSISGQFDISISTASNDVTVVGVRALQGIANGYRVVLTIPVYYD